jgi:midasin
VLLILDIKAAEDASDSTPEVAPPAAAANKGKLSTAERMRQLKAERESRLNRIQKSSILDMQLVNFEGGKVVKTSYFDGFPFPFYLVIKNMASIPEVVADAMRQWFELLNQ